MIEETVVVASVDNQRIGVVRLFAGSCGGCTQACGTSILGKALQRSSVLEVPADEMFSDLRPGDRIVLGMAEADLLKLSLRTYLFPLLGLFLGAVAGFQAGSLFGLNQDAGAALGGLLGLGGTFMILRFGRGGASAPRPVILRKLA